MKTHTEIPTLYPEQFKGRYVRGVDLSMPNFNVFFARNIEGTCQFINLPTPPHRSTAHECILLTEGSIRRSAGLEKYEVRKNSVFFLPANHITTIDYISTDAKGYYCHFDASVLIKKFINLHLISEFEFLRRLSNPLIALPPKKVAILGRLFERIVEENQAGKNEDLVQSYLFTVLLELKTYYQSNAPKNISPANYLTDRFRELIESNYKSKQLVSDYAAILNVSANHLTKTVTFITGKSPKQWIDELVVLEAKALLYQSRMTISEISYELGIEDPSYFGRMFKKNTGQSPIQFRRRLMEKE